MASVVINGVTYNNAPQVHVPKVGGGTAKFIDTSDATITGAAQMLNGVTAYDANGNKVTGNIPTKAAASYTPTTSDQTIAAAQYLGGAQTVKGDANLQSQYIATGVSIFGVVGSLSAPIVSQDSVTKILSIS